MQASACAKIILFGEHAVVYGKPAIAVPISSLKAVAEVEFNIVPDGLKIVAADLEQTIRSPASGEPLSENPLERTVQLVLNHFQAAPPNVTITIHSDIPIASGLGSGAAVSTALARAISLVLNRTWDNASLSEIIYQIEKLHHGTPSGIDNTVIVYQQPVYFIRTQPIQTFSIPRPFKLLIADTGKSALTRIAVGDVRQLYEADQPTIQKILDQIETLVIQARQAIETGAVADLGPLMTQNHALLGQLTVSSPELDMLARAALEAGALGAKLSGGGRGGNMIALVTADTAASVREKLLSAGAVRVFETNVE